MRIVGPTVHRKTLPKTKSSALTFAHFFWEGKKLIVCFWELYRICPLKKKHDWKTYWLSYHPIHLYTFMSTHTRWFKQWSFYYQTLEITNNLWKGHVNLIIPKDCQQICQVYNVKNRWHMFLCSGLYGPSTNLPLNCCAIYLGPQSTVLRALTGFDGNLLPKKALRMRIWRGFDFEMVGSWQFCDVGDLFGRMKNVDRNSMLVGHLQLSKTKR